jgi:hypothetical protein
LIDVALTSFVVINASFAFVVIQASDTVAPAEEG